MADSNDQLVGQSPAKFLPQELIAGCQTFRDACVLAWTYRTLPGLTKQILAAMTELYPAHVTDFFNSSPTDAKGGGRRSLPADKIADVERVLGKRSMSQYLARRAGLTIMEEVIAAKGP